MAGIDWSNWLTPTLARNPGAAVDVANSSNPQVTAQPVSHAINTVTTQSAINDYQNSTGTQSFWSKLGNGITSTLSWAAKPLNEIQKDYKFVHSVYTNNGFLPGFAATLGVIGGGVAGGLIAGPTGMAAGADAAGFAERKLAELFPGYKKSIANSEDPNYKVSAGRDFSNALGEAAGAVGWDSASKALKSTDKGLFGSAGSFISGITDMGGDVTFDPFSIIGRFGQAMRGGGLLKLDAAGATQVKYPLMQSIPGVKNFLESQSGAVLTSDQMDAVRNGSGVFNSMSRTYNRAIQDIADTAKNAPSSAAAAGEIAAKYPQLGAAAAGRLGSIDNVDDVHQFLKTQLYFGELDGTLAGQAMLPSRTLLRANFTEPLQDTLKVNKLTSGIYKTFSGYMPYSVDPITQKLSTTQFRWNAPDAATTVYRIARFGMGDEGAKEMAGKYAEAVAANDINAARIIKNQTYFEALKAMGLPDDNVLVQKAFEETNKVDEVPVGTQIYLTKPTGEPLGEYTAVDGTTKVGGINPHHAQDMFNIPDFFAMKNATRDAGRISKVMGGADEWIASKYTNTIFKPLALATMGFGLRVAAAELIPTFARYGIINTFKSKLAASAAKANYDLVPGEAKHVFPAALTALGMHLGIAPDTMAAGFPAFQAAKALGLKKAAELTAPQQLDRATELILANEGHILSEAVSPGHGSDASTAYQAGQAAHYYYQIQKNSPLFRELPEYTTYSADSPHFVPRYATNLQRASKEAVNRNVAKDFLNRLEQIGIHSEKPTYPGGSTFFHGTSKAFSDDKLEPNVYGKSHGNLFGDGLYTTDEPSVAKSYTKKGLGNEPVVYSTKWTGSGQPKILNLDHTAGPDVRDVFQKIADNSYEGYSFLEEALKNKNSTAADFYQALRSDFKDNETRDDEAAEVFQDITTMLSNKGYDAIRHVGGIFRGDAKMQHNVAIWLKPEDIEVKRLDSSFVKPADKLQIEDDIDKMSQHKRYLALREDLIDAEHKRILATPEGNYKPYNDESKSLTRWVDQDPRAFAADRVDGALGMMIGKDGTVLKNVATNLANGDMTDLNELAAMARKSPKSMPAAVAGPMLEPYVPAGGIGAKISAIADLGHKKVLGPLVANLSREPLYLVHYSEAMTRFEPMIARGEITADQAIRFAQTQASYAMLPQIHNTALRNQFSQMARNFLPFYFAQEQSLKRAFRTLKDTSIMSPAFSRGLRFYQLAEHALSDPTFMQTDSNGNKYVMLPGAGAFGEAIQNALGAFGVPIVSGLPITAKGSMTSLKSVLPELATPGVSPVLAISGNVLSSFFPEVAPLVKGTVGDIAWQRGVVDSLVPAPWMKNIVSAMTPVDINNAFNNAFASALTAAAYHNQLPDPTNINSPINQQFVDRIKNNTRSILMVKAVLGLLSPFAPAVSQEDAGLRDEFWNLVKQKGNFSDALFTFMGEHGSSAISYTVGRTDNAIPGATYPYVQGTVDYIKNNAQMFNDPKTQIGAFFLIPQDPNAKNSQTVYNELVGMKLREQRTAPDLLKQQYIAQGDAIMSQQITDHTNIIKQAKDNFDKYTEKQENQRWAGILSQMQGTNPIWYDSYVHGNGKLNAQTAYNQLLTILNSPNAPQTPQAQLVQGLMNDYAKHAQTLNDYKTFNISGAPVTIENENWQNHLLAVQQGEPRLQAVIKSVFSKLG